MMGQFEIRSLTCPRSFCLRGIAPGHIWETRPTNPRDRATPTSSLNLSWIWQPAQMRSTCSIPRGGGNPTPAVRRGENRSGNGQSDLLLASPIRRPCRRGGAALPSPGPDSTSAHPSSPQPIDPSLGEGAVRDRHPDRWRSNGAQPATSGENRPAPPPHSSLPERQDRKQY